MWTKLKNKDTIAGLMFLFFGIATIWLARDYPIGTAKRMGPAYFPILVGGALTVLGAVISVRSLWTPTASVRIQSLRPLLAITGAVLAFALLVNRLGLVLTTLVLILISCLAGPRYRVHEVALLYLLLILISVSLFIYALGLQFSLWPF